ncbi:MAG: hypothetical protein FWD31_15460, partial [Planctomycetaceae bacterium]|nr:hypothetical protein [Planctomycetaceae bacterium]
DASVEIAVMSNRHTPVRVVREIQSDNEIVEVTLKKGKTLRVRAVAPEGHPVTGVGISKLTWPDDHNREPMRFYRIDFGHDGILVWDNAPDIEADYTFDRGGPYSNFRTEEKTYRMRPGEKEYTITIVPR